MAAKAKKIIFIVLQLFLVYLLGNFLYDQLHKNKTNIKPLRTTREVIITIEQKFNETADATANADNLFRPFHK